MKEKNSEKNAIIKKLDKNNFKHDHFFRAVMKQPKVRKEFLENYLPAQVIELIDFKKIELMPADFITISNKKLDSDLICKMPIANKEAYLVTLIEHQSTADPMMPLRIMRYTCEIMHKHSKKNKTLPLVIPLVIYHGKKAYNYPIDIKKCIDAPAHLIDEFFLQPFKLIDLNKISDEILKEHLWSGLMLLTLKRAYSDKLEEIKNLFITVNEMYLIETNESQQLVEIVLNYLMRKSKLSKTKELEKELDNWGSKPFKEAFMTLGQAYEQKGEQRGRLEGEQRGRLETQQETAIRMLALGADIEFIQKATLLTKEEIQALKNQRTKKH